MCGIVGIFDSSAERAVDGDLLRRMNDLQSHRGPDDADVYVGAGIGLGHRRLSIIDLAGGHQPLFNEDGSVVIVYNGEIYNFQELAKELRAAGHVFRTNCDTEVIVHAWEEWGEACLDRFRGMFAFALWDEKKKTLFLARDRLGIKPLYYAALSDGRVIFGSELKALLPYPDLPRRLDFRAIEDYFAYGYVPDPKTIYRDVRKLEPGHFLMWRRGAGAPVLRQYWDVSFAGDKEEREDEAAEALIENMREAVRLRLISDVPLGAFLSGGVDSSGVVAMMAQLSSAPVNTCSIGFSQADHDESQYADLVAQRWSTNHTSEIVEADAFDVVDRLATIYDEPYADSSAIPTFQVCALARKSVTVALSGDGGDEIFAGYRRYRWHDYEERVRARLPQAVRGPLFGTMGRLYPKLDWAPKPLRAKSTLQALARSSADGYFHSVSLMHNEMRRWIYSPTMMRELQGYEATEVLRGHVDAAPAEHMLERIQYADLKTYLAGDILTKVDRASMANSLEVRVPLLDHHFVEQAARLSPALRLRGREGKYIFKKALEPHVPHDVLYREKMGFAVPLTAWFRGPLRERVRQSLMHGTLSETGLFNMPVIERMVDRHQSGQSDFSSPLWALIMFDSFLRRVHEPTSPSKVDSAPDRLSA